MNSGPDDGGPYPGRHAPPRDSHEFSYDPAVDGSLSAAVIGAVAAVANVDPTETRVPLDDAINPDALDDLFDGDSLSTARVTFPIWQFEVVVHADGRIYIYEYER